MSFFHTDSARQSRRAVWSLAWFAMALTLAWPLAMVQGSRAAESELPPFAQAAQEEPGFSAQGQIATDNTNSLRPQVASDSQFNLHVVWHDGDDGAVKYSKGTLNNNVYSWGPIINVFRPGGTSDYIYPRIAVDNNDQLHVVWTFNRTLYYKSFPATGGPDAGSQPIVLASSNAFYPSVTVGANNQVHVIWQGDQDGDADIYYRVGTAGNFGGTENVSDGPIDDDINNVSSDIAVDSTGVPHIVWYDGISGGKIRYARRIGGTWQVQTVSEAWSYFPSIVADAQGCVHMSWGNLGNRNLAVYRKACNGSFADTKEFTSTNTGRTTVGVSPSGNVVVGWTNKDGVETLFYSVIRGNVATAPRAVAPSGNNQIWPDATGRRNGTLILTWQQQNGVQFDPYFAHIDACSPGAAVIQGQPEGDVTAAATFKIFLPQIYRPVLGC